MKKITIEIPIKRKKELMAIAHKKGLLLNEYLNIVLFNKIPQNICPDLKVARTK